MGPPALLLAVDDAPRWLELITRPEFLIFSVPIVAIVGGVALKITQLILRHHERIVKIQHGIDPDAPRPPENR